MNMYIFSKKLTVLKKAAAFLLISVLIWSACNCIVFAENADVNNEITEMDELLDTIYSEDIPDDEVLELASNVEHDFKVVDEAVSVSSAEKIKKLLTEYAILREQSYETSTKGQNDKLNASDEVIRDEEEREVKLAEFCENEQVDLIDASITFKVNDIQLVHNSFELSVYEWVFFRYAEDGCSDLAGFGMDHIIVIDRDDPEWTIASDAYYDDLLTETESTAYAEAELESSVISMLSATARTIQAKSVHNYNVTYKYSPDDAVAYSDRYALSYNPSYGNYNSSGGDCANFVSQCLYAGGLPMTSGWYWYGYSNLSSSFISSTRLFNYLSDGWGDPVYNPSASQVQKGNPVFYQSKGASDFFHTSICVGTNSAGTPIINQHNSDRYHTNWSWGSGYNYATIKLYTGATAPTVDPSTPSQLSASGIVYPTNVELGKPFSLKGMITSNYSITYVKVTVFAENGSVAASQERRPYTTSFNIASVDDYISFGKLKAGKYTYRIEAADASGASKTLHENYFNIGAVAPSTPTLTIDTGASETVFKWAPAANATSYNIYVYNSDGAEALVKKGIYGTSFSAELATGEYYAVLEAVNDNFNYCSTSGSKVPFATTGAPSTLSAKDLSYPTEIETGRYFILKGTISSNYRITEVKVTVSTSGGIVKISQTRYPNSRTFDIADVDDDISFGSLAAGKYVYKVEATDESGTSKVLHTNNFNVGKVVPAVPELKAEVSRQDGKVELSWGRVTNATSYNLIILDDAGKAVLNKRGLTGTGFEYVLENGSYSAQLEAVNDNFYDSSTKSRVVTFTVEIEAVEPEPTGEIYISGADVKAGNTVRLSVYVADNPGITSFDLNVLYDSGVMTPLSVSGGRVLEQGSVVSGTDRATGALNVTWNGSTSGDGVLFYVTFRVDSSARSGMYQVEPATGSGGIYCAAANSAAVMMFSAGSVKVTAADQSDGNDFMSAEIVSMPNYAYANEKFYLEVETSKNVSGIKLCNENGTVINSTIMNKSDVGDKYLWRLYTSIGTTGSSRTVSVLAKPTFGDFRDVGCSSTIEIRRSEIVSITPEKQSFPAGDNIIVNVVATRDLINLRFTNENDLLIGCSVLEKSANSNGTVAYRCSLDIQTPGERVVTLKAANGASSQYQYSKTFTLSINKSSDIISAKFSKSDVEKNVTVDLTVVTTKNVSRLAITNEYGNKIGASLISKKTDSSGNYVFVYRMSFGTAGNNRYIYVNAVDPSGKVTNETSVVRINVLGIAPRLYSASASRNTVKVNETVTLTVVSNTSVNSVKVMNDRGVSMARVSNAAYNNDGTVTWTLTMAIGTAGTGRVFSAVGHNSSGELSNTLPIVFNVV